MGVQCHVAIDQTIVAEKIPSEVMNETQQNSSVFSIQTPNVPDSKYWSTPLKHCRLSHAMNSDENTALLHISGLGHDSELPNGSNGDVPFAVTTIQLKNGQVFQAVKKSKIF